MNPNDIYSYHLKDLIALLVIVASPIVLVVGVRIILRGRKAKRDAEILKRTHIRKAP